MMTFEVSNYLQKSGSNDKYQNKKQLITKTRNFESTKIE